METSAGKTAFSVRDILNMPQSKEDESKVDVKRTKESFSKGSSLDKLGTRQSTTSVNNDLYRKESSLKGKARRQKWVLRYDFKQVIINDHS